MRGQGMCPAAGPGLALGPLGFTGFSILPCLDQQPLMGSEGKLGIRKDQLCVSCSR